MRVFAFILLDTHKELGDYYFCLRKTNSDWGDRKHLEETGIQGDRQQWHIHPQVARTAG
jgi:hypothetical protein